MVTYLRKPAHYLALLLVLVITASSGLADEATKTAKINEVLALTHSSQMIDQMFDQMRAMQMAQFQKLSSSSTCRERMRESQQKIFSLMKDRFTWEKMKGPSVKAYSDTFTEEEIDGILSFYRSPAGQSMLQKTPALMQKIMGIGQQLASEALPDIQRLMEEDSKKGGSACGGSTPQP